jgi:hypothetical protein
LKEFGLNLKRKVCFKKSLKKKKKKREKAYLPSLRPSRPAGPPKPSRSSPPNRPPFLFSPRMLTTGPLLPASPPPFPFFFSTPLPSRPGAAA